ncbi:MAG: PEP-CTERM sorting domain-containing protein [Phycisphaerales bacterium]|nr:PEP-CTERM sorting domain-containing protein [Phycisphaerales bacterium]
MKHALMLVVVIAGAPVAMAQVDIRMDLATSAGSTAGNWNNISSLTGLTPNLVDFTSGAPTTISINGAGSPWQSFVGDTAGAFPNQDWLIQPATQDGAGLQSGLTGIFRIAGLTDGVPYKVEVVSARTTFGYLNTITVDGSTADRTFKGTPVVTPWNSTTDGLAAGNWLIWDDVFPTRGELAIMDVSGPGTLGIVNAIRISAIPAPGTGLALALGAGLIARRRRA